MRGFRISKSGAANSPRRRQFQMKELVEIAGDVVSERAAFHEAGPRIGRIRGFEGRAGSGFQAEGALSALSRHAHMCRSNAAATPLRRCPGAVRIDLISR
jgi:hypothetical protein